MAPVLYWTHDDYRLRDNPALGAAAQSGQPVIPVALLAHNDGRAPGPVARSWRMRAMSAFRDTLHERGSNLVVRTGGSAWDLLHRLVRETDAEAVYWNRRYEPGLVERDAAIEDRLAAHGIEVQTFRSFLLHEPLRDIRTQKGAPYQVFTYFWRSFRRQIDVPRAEPTPQQIPVPVEWPRSDTLDGMLPPGADRTVDELLPGHHRASEEGARDRLHAFLDQSLSAYSSDRDRPDRDGTSRLSPHLRFGTVSPRQVWTAVQSRRADWDREEHQSAADEFLRQLGWREFSYHVLVHHPHTVERPLREKFENFPWQSHDADLDAWKEGRTGYPIVDAGMRQLRETGWMHNRIRMLVASFLTKDLPLPWQEGETFFWDRLVDADPANNIMGWQWAAGCGADAQPFFRIFNPVSQARTYDPDGSYTRRYVPELRYLPDRFVHAPWEAPEAVRREAHVQLGVNYPEPIVDHAEARAQALEAYQVINE